MDGEGGASAEVEVGLPVERCYLYALVEDAASEVSGTGLAVASVDDHASAPVEHVATNVVVVGTFDVA